MDIPVTKKQFLQAYYRFQNWDYDPSILFIEDRLLNEKTPLRLHRSIDKLVIQIDQPHWDQVPLIEPNDSNQDILTALKMNHVQLLEQTLILFAKEPVELPNYDGLTIKLLTHIDRMAIGHLKAACEETDLVASQIRIDDDLLYGVYHQEDLLAMGSLWILTDELANLQILVHPRFRNIGLGYLLFGWLIRIAFKKEKIPFIIQSALDPVLTHLSLKAKLVEAISSTSYHSID